MKAITFTSATNAYALYIGARQLGIELVTADDDAVFPIPRTSIDARTGWLLFTEEASLRRALNAEIKGNFLPETFPDELLDNKWAFVHWLEANPQLTQGLRQWSLSAIDEISYPCLVKAKHSWVGSMKLPRGWVCRTPEESARCLMDMSRQGFKQDYFFFQEWMGDTACRVISVCGFHDSKNQSRNLTAVVERISAHRRGLSCSAAVETVSDLWQLEERSAEILTALGFRGPYELEYLVCGDRVLVLELNPRFWMQHAIFFVARNGLLRRYFGLDTDQDHEIDSLKNVVWFDGVHLVHSIITLKIGFLWLIVKSLWRRENRVMIWPPLPIAALVSMRLLWRNRAKVMHRLARFFRLAPV